jgi:hypothetical protein
MSTWLLGGYGFMADRGLCSGQWGQRCAISVQAPSEALAVRKAKRRMLWSAGIRYPVWKVRAASGGPSSIYATSRQGAATAEAAPSDPPRPGPR